MSCDIIVSGEFVHNLQIDKSLGDRVLSRESTKLEFKASFNIKNLPKYSKTMATFANNRGGCILFGITDNPREFRGLNAEQLKRFDEVKLEEITSFLNSYFSPEITWDIETQTFHGKKIGILLVYESTQKPIVCTKYHGDGLQESTIYYRYHARSQAIRYTELKNILDTCRIDEGNKWRKLISSIAQAGVQNVGILNLDNGELSGTGDKTLLIDESLLPHIQFIKECEFSEKSGAPTLKLIGEVKQYKVGFSDKSVTEIIITLYQNDIINDFLKQKQVISPKEYLKSICNGSTGYLPCYYYISLANMTVEEACDLIKSFQSRAQTQKKLLERLENDTTLHIEIKDTGTSAYTEKLDIKQKILREENLQTIAILSFGRLSQAILSLTVDEVKQHKEYILDLLEQLNMEQYSTESQNNDTMFRKAVCWIDEALYLR